MNNNENEKAISYYKKSMAINPGNSNGVEMLKKLGVDYDPEEFIIELSKEQQKAYVGEYEISAPGILTIQIEGGKLTVKHPAIPTQTLLCYPNNQFLLIPDNVPLTFTMDEENKPIGFEAQAPGGMTVKDKKIK